MSKPRLQVLIRDAQLNYAALFDSVPDFNGESEVFKVLALVKEDSLSAKTINNAVKKIMEMANNNKLISPIRNSANASYIAEGLIGVNAKAKLDEKRLRRGGPIVCDAKRNIITSQSDAYSGCYGNVMTTFYVANGRICVGLSGVQITVKDTRLDGQASSADQLFDEVDGFELVELEDETAMFDSSEESLV